MPPLDDLAALTKGSPLDAEARPFGTPAADPLKVDAKDLLPPAAALAPAALATLGAPQEAEEPDEEVTLDFFGDDLPVRSFPLRYPFRLGGPDGEPVREVEVHQLTVAEVGRAYGEIVGNDGRYDRFKLYARMVRVKGTGTPLSAAVLRKMKAVDGEPITDAAFGFLPPSFRVTVG